MTARPCHSSAVFWGANAHVADVRGVQHASETGTGIRPVVGLDHVHAEREESHDVVEKADPARGDAGVELQDADPCAVIDRRELIQSLPRCGDRLDGISRITRAFPAVSEYSGTDDRNLLRARKK